MFESVNPPVPSSRNRFATLAVSVVAHTIVIGLAVVAPFLYYINALLRYTAHNAKVLHGYVR